jgi:hypothetical protein
MSEYKICCLCKKATDIGVSIGNPNDKANFYYIPQGEAAHLECYVEHVINSKVDNILQETIASRQKEIFVSTKDKEEQCNAVKFDMTSYDTMRWGGVGPVFMQRYNCYNCHQEISGYGTSIVFQGMFFKICQECSENERLFEELQKRMMEEPIEGDASHT